MDATPPRIMVDGEVLPAGTPAAIPLDDGLVRGDGVFEGLRCYDGRLRTPHAHLERLARSAREIDLPVDLEVLAAELGAFCDVVPASCGVRVMLTRGGRRIIREEPLPRPAASWELSPQWHRPTPLLSHSKTLSYAANMQANRRARAAGADEALFVEADTDRVLEGPTSSFVWLEGEQLVAPPLELGILDSITRRLVAEVTPLAVRPATLAELADADGGMLVSTVLESQPVHAVTGVARWDPEGRRLSEIRAALGELVRARTADPAPVATR
ncbi:MAG TPA: aminotransferase class IV [Miltoncostaeaceae bacterium]|nr:aminotransferase class IV [Miltoncostaeaceae bacterium]